MNTASTELSHSIYSNQDSAHEAAMSVIITHAIVSAFCHSLRTEVFDHQYPKRRMFHCKWFRNSLFWHWSSTIAFRRRFHNRHVRLGNIRSSLCSTKCSTHPYAFVLVLYVRTFSSTVLQMLNICYETSGACSDSACGDTKLWRGGWQTLRSLPTKLHHGFQVSPLSIYWNRHRTRMPA